MKPETRTALNALNRAFYSKRGDDFDASRDHPWPGWSRVLEHCSDATGREYSERSPMRVLDVGCGNGRFAHFLMHRLTAPTEYIGVDASHLLLDRARETLRSSPPHISIVLTPMDFVEGDGPRALPDGPFDLIAVFGVLHHVPGEQTRRELIEALANRLALGGHLAVTAWQFADNARFERTTLAPEVLHERGLQLGFDAADLDYGDHLLGFGGQQQVPRYCHQIDDAEFDRLSEGLGLESTARFLEDGKSRDLNAYHLLVRPA